MRLKGSPSNLESSPFGKKLQKLIGNPGESSAAAKSLMTEVSEHKLLNSLLTKSSPNKSCINSMPTQAIHFTPTLVSNATNTSSSTPIKSLESLFDELQSEIESNVASSESRKRVAFYVTQIQQAYNEKILYLVKSRLEMQEAASATQLENEALKARVKYLDIENQLLVSGATKSAAASIMPPYGALTRHLYQSQQQLYAPQMSPNGKELSASGSSSGSSSSASSATPSKYFAKAGAFTATAAASLAPFHNHHQYVNALKCEMMSTQ